jgi:hypothetical protein
VGSLYGILSTSPGSFRLAIRHYTLTYGLVWRLRRIVRQIQADYVRMIYGGQYMPNIQRFQAKLKYTRINRMRYSTYMCTCTLANILTYDVMNLSMQMQLQQCLPQHSQAQQETAGTTPDMTSQRPVHMASGHA